METRCPNLPVDVCLRQLLRGLAHPCEASPKNVTLLGRQSIFLNGRRADWRYLWNAYIRTLTSVLRASGDIASREHTWLTNLCGDSSWGASRRMQNTGNSPRFWPAHQETHPEARARTREKSFSKRQDERYDRPIWCLRNESITVTHACFLATRMTLDQWCVMTDTTMHGPGHA